MTLALICVVGVAPASASKGLVEEFGSTGSGAGDRCLPTDPADCLAEPEDIAVNSLTGDLFIADSNNYRIVRFGADGQFKRTWGWDVDPEDPSTGFEICVAPGPCQAGTRGRVENGQLFGPGQIALDQVNGIVYVAGNDELRIQKFTEDGEFLGQYSSGSLGMLAHHRGIALAVKNGNNSLLAADRLGSTDESDDIGRTSSGRVLWLDQAGNQLLSFDPGDKRGSWDFGSVKGGGVTALGSDAKGDIFGIQWPAARYPEEVNQWTAFGSLIGPFAPEHLEGRGAFALEADPINDRIYVGRYDRPVKGLETTGNALREIAELEPDGTLVDVHATGMAQTVGFTVNASTGVIYSASAPKDRILVIDDVTNLPVPTITSIETTGTTATLRGTVNPNGTDYDTGYHWEYRIEGADRWTSAPETDIAVGNGSAPVTLDPQELTGLEPNTNYEVRLFATRTGGAGFAMATDDFTTDTVPAVATERPAYPIAATSAQLRGVLNPRKSDAQYYFEYGTTEDYGQTTPTRSIAATKADVPVYATVTGLQPETTYHYRVVVDNGTGGEVRGEDVTFTTRASADMAWPARGIELASPPDTASQNVTALLDRTSDRVVWSTIGGTPGSPTGTIGVLVAERNLATPQGWQSRSFLPRADQLLDNGSAPVAIAEASPDYRTAVGFTQYAGRRYFFKYQTGGDRTDLGSMPSSDKVNNTISKIQVTDDLRHVFQISTTRMITAHPTGGSWQIYDLAYDPPRLVSRMPNNSVPFCGVPGESGLGVGFGDSHYPMHSDPQQSGESVKVFFESLGAGCETPAANSGPPGVRDLYVRDDGGTDSAADDTTTLISGPQAAGEGKTASFIRATADGREVLYVTTAQNDVADTNDTNDIYSWTRDAGNQCVTCAFASDAHVESRGRSRTVMASADLRRIYFNSAQQLIPGRGEAGSDANLYYLDRDRPEDGLDYVAQAEADPEINEMAEDGTLLVFSSTSRENTPDATGGFNQFFRYDAAERRVECITCPPPGVAPAQVHGLQVTGSVATGAIHHLIPRVILSADGSTFAFQSSVPYVTADINGGPDIYEWRRDGRLRLVTNGVTEFPRGISGEPTIQGVSADGRNIMFAVAAKLTGFELERTRQVFVARTGGGFPPPVAAPDRCVGEACQGPLQPVPRHVEPGSETLRGAGNVRKAPPAKKSCPRGKVRRGKSCVTKAKPKQCSKAKAKSKARAKCQGKGQARKGNSKARGKSAGKGRTK